MRIYIVYNIYLHCDRCVLFGKNLAEITSIAFLLFFLIGDFIVVVIVVAVQFKMLLIKL